MMDVITVRCYNNLKDDEIAQCWSVLTPMAYYSGNIFTVPSCPSCPDNKICADGKGYARCIVGPDTFDLT